jgi:hypothetical protein
VAAVAQCWPLAQCNGSGHGCGSRRHRRATTVHCPGGDKDTGGNCNGRGTYNNQQLTKKSGGNSNRNGVDDSNGNDNGNEGNGGGSSLARAWHWRWWQRGSGIGSSSAAVAGRWRQQQRQVSSQRMRWGTHWKGRRGGGGRCGPFRVGTGSF